MTAPKKARIDPALVPFADALAELLAADLLRNPAPVRPARGATSKANRASKAHRAFALAARAIDRLESGAGMTRTDRRGIARLIRVLTRSYFQISTPPPAGRAAHRPAGETQAGRDAEVIAALIDRYGCSEATAIRAIDKEAHVDDAAYQRLHRAYQRLRARDKRDGLSVEILDRPRRVAEWLERRQKK